MKVKIVVKTPVGEAEKAESRLKKFILAFNSKPTETKFINSGCFEWYMDVEARRYKRLLRNVYAFKHMAELIIRNKVLGKVGGVAIGKDQMEELKDMMLNNTSIDVVVL